MKTAIQILKEHLDLEAKENSNITFKYDKTILAAMESYASQFRQQPAEENRRLESGRDYLMVVKPEDLTVENALEAFGFGRNGLLKKKHLKQYI